MKKFGLLTLIFAALTLRAASVRVAAEPRRPAAGESFTLVLETDAPGPPEFTLPRVEGLRCAQRISSTRSSIRIVNGRREQSFRYGVAALAERPGEYTLPPFDVKLDGRTVRTNSFRFTVIDPAASAASGAYTPDRPQARLTLEPERPLYVGETATVRLAVIVPAGMRATIGQVEKRGFGDAAFLPQGPRRAQFVSTGMRPAVRDGHRYDVYELTGLFQPQKPGEFTPVCELTMGVSQPAGDDFFGGFFDFGPTRELRVTATAARKLTVRALPPPPAGSVATGLVGDWHLELLPPAATTLRTGEVAELTLRATGPEHAEMFAAPPLTLPGVRAYPPEVRRRTGGFTVKYLFVPLTPGPRELAVKFAVFDPERGSYRLEPGAVKFTVVPGAVVAPPPAAPVPPPAAATAPAVVLPAAPMLLPPGKPVRLPLTAGTGGWTLLFTGVGAALFLLAAWRRFRRPAPERQAQRERRRRLTALAAQIRSVGAAAALDREGTAALAAALGLPPGATPEEIAAAIPDPELAEWFRQRGDAAFHPGGKVDSSPALDRKLSAFCKRLLLPLCCLLLGTLHADFAAGAAAFDAGRYAEARREFARAIDPDAPDPAMLYNLGCADNMLGEYPRATLAFEQALLLAPWDARYRAARREAGQKLSGAPEEPDHSFTGFVAGLRDRLRPDQYLLAAAAIFALAGAVALAGRFPGRKAVGVALAAAFVVALAAAWTQSRDRYAPDRARVVVARAELRRIPAAGGRPAGLIPGGTELRLLDRRGGWTQVRLPDGGGGWLKNSDVERVFPHGVR